MKLHLVTSSSQLTLQMLRSSRLSSDCKLSFLRNRNFTNHFKLEILLNNFHFFLKTKIEYPLKPWSSYSADPIFPEVRLLHWPTLMQLMKVWNIKPNLNKNKFQGNMTQGNVRFLKSKTVPHYTLWKRNQIYKSLISLFMLTRNIFTITVVVIFPMSKSWDDDY